jgi:phage terminase large subunit
LFRPSRYKILHGGRGSAKSWSVARALLIEGTKRPERIPCFREFQNSLADSVHRLLEDQVAELNLSGFYDVQESKIVGLNGTEFIFAGLRHNIASIKSFEGSTKAWIEEGQTASKRSLDVLIPTIFRTPGAELWITMNPDLAEDEAYQRFIVDPPSGAIVEQMNWIDNPWFPEGLLAEKDFMKARDLDTYNNIWGGQCRSRVTGALWTKEIFNTQREAAPESEAEREVLLATLARVVIAIDPSGCSGEEDKRSTRLGSSRLASGTTATAESSRTPPDAIRRMSGRTRLWGYLTAGRRTRS